VGLPSRCLSARGVVQSPADVRDAPFDLGRECLVDYCQLPKEPVSIKRVFKHQNPSSEFFDFSTRPVKSHYIQGSLGIVLGIPFSLSDSGRHWRKGNLQWLRLEIWISQVVESYKSNPIRLAVVSTDTFRGRSRHLSGYVCAGGGYNNKVGGSFSFGPAASLII
jgi:hypothetical protein